MKKTVREIYRAFEGKLIGNGRMKNYVCEVLALMEDEVVGYITANCWFFSSYTDSLGYAFTGNDFKDQHLIFLSDELFRYDENQIRYTIAHEIGHVILRHRNSVMEPQSKKEVELQEKQADTFARKYVIINL